MPNDYQSIYIQPAAPAHRDPLDYPDTADRTRSDEQLRLRKSRLAKQQAALWRAKLAERWIVFTLAGFLAAAMLPALVFAAAIAATVAIWRCTARWLKRCGARMRAEADCVAKSRGDGLARRGRVELHTRAVRQTSSCSADADTVPQIANV